MTPVSLKGKCHASGALWGGAVEGHGGGGDTNCKKKGGRLALRDDDVDGVDGDGVNGNDAGVADVVLPNLVKDEVSESEFLQGTGKRILHRTSWNQCCCSVWWCVVAVCGGVLLQCVVVCCSRLQCVTVCCSVLQCDAVCCSVL